MRDEETATKMTSTDTQAWFGPGRFIVGYPISNGRFFNVALVTPRDEGTPVTYWNQPGDPRELQREFADFSPFIQKLTGLVEKCAKWTIAEIPELSTWSSRSGRTVLLGDSAHVMSPHAAQGVVMALEDAAALTEALSRLRSLEDLPRLTRVYEKFRKPRIARVASIAKGNGKSWMFRDGLEQMARDSRFRRVTDDYLQEMRDIGSEKIAKRLKAPADMDAQWPQPSVLMWLYGYDAKEAFNSFIDNHSARDEP